MYCKICGTEQLESANYCSHDGVMMNSFGNTVTLQQADTTYCRTCGSQNEVKDSYCMKCGEPTLKVVAKTRTVERTIQKEGISTVDQKGVLQRGVFGGALVSLAMLFVAWIGKLVLGNTIQGTLGEIFGDSDFSYVMNGLLSDSFGGISNSILNYHLLSITVESTGGKLLLDIPFFILICIPILTISGVGMWLQKKYQMSSVVEKGMTACMTGLIYGLFLMIVSFIAANEITMDNLLENTLVVNIGYSSVASLIAGVIYGTLFSFIGMLLYAGRTNRAAYIEKLLPYGSSMYYGFMSAIVGLMISSVVFVGAFMNILPDYTSSNDDETFMIATQIAPKAWGAAHFSPLRIESEVLGEEFRGEFNESLGELSSEELFLDFSYVGGVSISGTSMKDLFVAEGASVTDIQETEVLNGKLHRGLLLTLIPIALLFLAGRKLARNHLQKMYMTLAVLSGTYAITAVTINFISSITINGKTEGMLAQFIQIDGTLLSVQNHPMYLLLFSFVIAYAASFAGMKLVKK